MIENKLLYLNLSVDSSDTSLGFVETWISNFLNDFDKIDVLTLNKSIEAESISEKLKNMESIKIQVIQKLKSSWNSEVLLKN